MVSGWPPCGTARRVLCAMVLTLLLLPLFPAVPAPVLAAPRDPYPDRDGFFGIVGHDPYYEWNTDPKNFKDEVNKVLLENMMKEMASAGAKWVRIEFFAEYGDLYGPGAFKFEKYDWFLTDLAPRYGINVLGVLSYGIVRDTNPTYMLNRINDAPDRGDGSNPYIRGFAERAAEIAGHYTGYVAAWEILNEPNSNTHLFHVTKGSQQLILADRTAAVMAAVYPRLKQMKGDVPVVLGGLINTAGSYPNDHDIGYLRQVYGSEYTRAAGYTPGKGGAPWDVVADHPYELAAEQIAPHVRDMYAVMAAAGEGHKKIWITEIGEQARTPEVPKSGVIPLALDEVAQANFLTRVYTDLKAMRGQVERVFWFKYEDFVTTEDEKEARYGLVGFKRDGDSPGAPWPRKEAMRAYAAQARPAALPTTPEDPNTPTAPDARYFPETQHWIAGPFRLYWERNGGRDRFGLPRTSVFVTGGVVVQVFERARFEFRKENAGKVNEVELGLIGIVMTKGRAYPTVATRPVYDLDALIPVPAGAPSLNPTATPAPTATPRPTVTPTPTPSPTQTPTPNRTGTPDSKTTPTLIPTPTPADTPAPTTTNTPPPTPGPVLFTGFYFPETRHTLSGPFLCYWQLGGGLQSFGFPISEPLVEKNPDNGNLYTVQYFERARLEYHPEYTDNPLPVVVGLLGNELIREGGWWR